MTRCTASPSIWCAPSPPRSNLPLALQVYDNSGQVTDAVVNGACDLAFMPRDAAREARIDFGPAYFLVASTYLVPAGSKIQTIDEVNRPGVRIVAISNTTTARSAKRTAPNATVEEVASVDLMTADGGQGAGRRLRAVARLFCRPLAQAAGRARASGKLPADRHRGGGAQRPPGRAQACDRADRRRQEIRSGARARSMPPASRTPRSRRRPIRGRRA